MFDCTVAKQPLDHDEPDDADTLVALDLMLTWLVGQGSPPIRVGLCRRWKACSFRYGACGFRRIGLS